ncbi:uncharacterized protein LOC135081761 [Ostrinia nubilalis]|uniref:uncharacterized protein LOC135081761 n=1 Tax=Ostrinia nubilalis TaxID=29057 RepID=UPI00308262AD
MILFVQRVVCVFVTIVLLSAQCSSIRINYVEAVDAEPAKEIIKKNNDDLHPDEPENPPPNLPFKIKVPLTNEARENLLLRVYSEDKLQKLLLKTSPSKTRVPRQASHQLYPNLTPSPYQTHSVQYYNNSSPNSNSQYGQTNPYNQQWQNPSTPSNPTYPGRPNPSYNPNTYGPSGFPNPYVQYNNSQNPNGPHPQNYPSIHPGNYTSSRPNYNPSQRPPYYPPNTKHPQLNPSYNPYYNSSSYHPSQRPPYYPGQNTSQHQYNVNNNTRPYAPYNPPYNTPHNPPYNTPQNPPYNTPQNPPYNTPQNPPYNTPQNPPYNSPHNPSYNPSQRPSYYQHNSSSPYYPNNHNFSSNSNYNTTPRPTFGQYPNTNTNYQQNFTSPYNSNNNFSSTFYNTSPRPFGQFPNTDSKYPYNPYPSGYNPAGFPDNNFRPSVPSNKELFGTDDLFKPILPRNPQFPTGYDPKTQAEHFAKFGYK